MDKKLLTIAIALIILAIVVAPVAAVLPATNPLPKGTGWNTVWELLQDLQNQITNIQLIPGPQGPTGPPGSDGVTVHFGEWQEIEVDETDGAYYSGDPAETDGFVRFMCTANKEIYIYGFTGNYPTNIDVIAYDKSPAYGSGPQAIAPTSIVFPVQQGKKWGVDWDTCNLKLDIAWMPVSA
jgi:hypothetical protein